MSIDTNLTAAARLLGRWSTVENSGKMLPEGVFTQLFTDDGKLACIIQDGDETTVLNCQYQVSGDEIIIDGPKEYANPNHVRMRFWFDEAGHLVTDDRQGVRSRFSRVPSPAPPNNMLKPTPNQRAS